MAESYQPIINQRTEGTNSTDVYDVFTAIDSFASFNFASFETKAFLQGLNPAILCV